MRALFLLLMLPWAAVRGQSPDSLAAVAYSQTFTVPLARAQTFDAATLAWQRSFGKEPGAKLATSDRTTGLFEGSARINFRSALLTAREETMGTISYRVTIQAGNGECTVRVTGFVHTGNATAMKGGVSFGTLIGTVAPPNGQRGISRRNEIQIWQELKATTEQRITALLSVFGSTLRQASSP